eukprot:3817577-Ditylum_brightwellii.AAC.2
MLVSSLSQALALQRECRPDSPLATAQVETNNAKGDDVFLFNVKVFFQENVSPVSLTHFFYTYTYVPDRQTYG